MRILRSLLLILIGGIIISAALMAPPPLQEVRPFFNGVFPRVTPGAKGAWEVVDYLPENEIPSPLKMQLIPNTNDVLVISGSAPY